MMPVRSGFQSIITGMAQFSVTQFFNKKGQKALRKFFDVVGREIIMENFVTGDILVRWEDKDWIFRNKTDFIAFFIRCAGLEDTAVYFNSLSYPFFASQALSPNGFRDALFWHEPVDGEIPAICRSYCMIRERGQSAYLYRTRTLMTGL